MQHAWIFLHDFLTFQANYLCRCLIQVGLMLALPVRRDVAFRVEITELWDGRMTATFEHSKKCQVIG